MKKIISLLLALAVMFSLSLTGTAAFAAEIKYSDIVIGDGELSETGENAASDNAKVIQAIKTDIVFIFLRVNIISTLRSIFSAIQSFILMKKQPLFKTHRKVKI